MVCYLHYFSLWIQPAKNNLFQDIFPILHHFIQTFIKEIKKSYIAAVDGIPTQKKGVLESYLEGRYAKTVWEVQAAGREMAFIHCQPETGRKHQIRLHLAGMGYPILGDAEYCRHFRSSYPVTRHFLHAHQLEFNHPFNDKKLIITSLLPKDMNNLLNLVNS